MAKNNNTHTLTYRLALTATLLAIVVVVLGAYCRLVDGGLGCPDWPGCYGQVTVPETQHAVKAAETLYPGTPVEPKKAWSEMVHRYFAGTLGLLVVALAIIALARIREKDNLLILPILLLGVVAFQALLGAWTVTLKLLPVVVMGHLLGGLTLLALLFCLTLCASNAYPNPEASWQRLRPWALAGLVIVFIQIALGGWTSSNYSAIICPHFPFCQGSLFPTMDLKGGFNVLQQIGPNYQGGNLEPLARIAIQMVHRYGAVITGLYVFFLAGYLIFSPALRRLRNLGIIIFTVLILQITLGILNVEWVLPLPIAVGHNAIAALLLLTMVALNYCAFRRNTTSIV